MSQQRYRLFCQKAPDMPIYMEAWYLDAVCSDGRWDAVFVEKNGHDIAAMPFFRKQKLHWHYVGMPRLCKFMGPFLLPEFRDIRFETEMYTDLIAQLPPELSAYEQDSNYQVKNWLPFYWRGFRQSTRYSYVLDLQLSETELWNNVRKNYRNKVKKAAPMVELLHDLPLRTLYDMISMSFERQDLRAPFDFAFLETLYAALKSHNATQLFFARDRETRQIHAAAMIIWDKTSAYYLLSGSDPALRNSGAAILLDWEVIRYAKNVLNLPVFDFEGSMMPNIEPGRRAFGAQQIPYFRLQKEWSPIWKLGKWLWR